MTFFSKFHLEKRRLKLSQINKYWKDLMKFKSLNDNRLYEINSEKNGL